MTILVTGATGYIGGEFIRAFQKEYNIIALVREESDTSKLKALDCKVLSFSSLKDIHKIFEQEDITGIVHFASHVIVDHSTKDIDSLIGSNIKFGTCLLEACKTFQVKWFVNTGTFWQNYKGDSYNPVNLYAATKEAFETIARYYTETSSLVFTTIKLNDTFGPNDSRPKVFNLWDSYSKSGEVLDMTEGGQIVDISFIKDVINAFGCMVENLQRDGNRGFNNKSYVVTSNQRMTLRKLSKVFEKVTQRKLNINWGGRNYRQREVMVPVANIEKVPNWEQKYSLEEAMRITMDGTLE